MSRKPRNPRRRQQPTPPPWPTPTMLEQMGLVNCADDGCRVYIDPVNLPSGKCLEHQRAARNRGPRGPRRQETTA